MLIGITDTDKTDNQIIYDNWHVKIIDLHS